MIYLAIIFLTFSALTKAGRPLSLIEDDILEEIFQPNSVSKVELKDSTGEIKMSRVEDCEDQAGRRCVHFTECDQDGFIAEDSSQVSQLINVR